MDKKKLKWYSNLITVDSVKVVITGSVNKHLVLMSIGAIEKIILLIVHSVEGTNACNYGNRFKLKHGTHTCDKVVAA